MNRILTQTAAALIAATALTSAFPAAAQSTLERMEAVSTTMNQMMNEAFIAEIPALEGRLPDPEWDDTMRAAYTCMHDAYVERAGEEAVSDMIAQMEASVETLTSRELLEGAVAVENPDGITDADAQAIVGNCGLMEAFMARMAASGAMEIMMSQ